MANTIQIKRADSNSATTEPTGLLSGEFALLQASKKLFIGRHNGSSVDNYHIPSLDNLTGGAGVTKTAASAAAIPSA